MPIGIVLPQPAQLELIGPVASKTMSDLEVTRALLSDQFQRCRELVVELTDGLTDQIGTYRPDAPANSPVWLLWHATRVQDDHVADLAGVDQAWPAWRERFGLSFSAEATGFGQSAEEVGEVRVGGELMADYHADVDALTRRYLDGLTEAELSRVVDTRWDPPVTAAARLVSVLSDVSQHLGQAAYVRGLAERRSR